MSLFSADSKNLAKIGLFRTQKLAIGSGRNGLYSINQLQNNLEFTYSNTQAKYDIQQF